MADGLMRSLPGQTGRSSRGLAALAYLIAVFLFANLGLVVGRDLPRWDAFTYYAPAQMLVADHVRAGELVQWNPWSNAGSPDGADPQFGALSPVNLLIGLFFGSTLTGFRVYWLLMWVIGGITFVLWVRSAGQPPWIGAVAGLGFMFCGFFTGHAEHTSFVVSAALLIPALWRLDVALSSGWWLPATECGAILGLSALSGYPGLTLFNSAFLFVWALGRALFCPGHSRAQAAGVIGRTCTAMSRLLVVAVVSGVVLCPTFFAFLQEGKGYTDRVGALDRERVVTSNALHPGALATFVSPQMAVIKLANRELWPGTDVSSTSVYLTPALLAFGIGSLLISPRNRWRWWLATTAAFFLMASMGDAIPVRGWLYDFFWPSRFFRHSSILRIYYIIPAVILAVEFLKDLVEGRARLVRKAGIVVMIVAAALSAAAAATALHIQSFDLRHGTGMEGGFVPAFVVWIGSFLVGTALVLATRSVRCWLPTAMMVLVAVDGVTAVRLSHKLMVARDRMSRGVWEKALANHRGSLELGSEGFDRIERAPYGRALTNLNWLSKDPVLSSYGPFSNRYYRGWIKEPTLAAMALGTERTWFAADAAQCAVNLTNFHILRHRSRRFGAIPLFLHVGPQHSGGEDDCTRLAATLPVLNLIPAVVERYRVDQLVLTVDAEQDGFILVTDRFAPGWRATLDARPVEIINASFGFRAVRLEKGRHRVAFSYRLAGYPWLLLLSWACLAGVTSATVVTSLRRVNRRGEMQTR